MYHHRVTLFKHIHTSAERSRKCALIHVIRDETQSIERGLIAVAAESGRLICMELHRSANRVNYQADKNADYLATAAVSM